MELPARHSMLWRAEDNVFESVLSFHLHVGPRDGTQVISLLHGKSLYSVSHLIGPMFLLIPVAYKRVEEHEQLTSDYTTEETSFLPAAGTNSGASWVPPHSVMKCCPSQTYSGFGKMNKLLPIQEPTLCFEQHSTLSSGS